MHPSQKLLLQLFWFDFIHLSCRFFVISLFHTAAQSLRMPSAFFDRRNSCEIQHPHLGLGLRLLQHADPKFVVVWISYGCLVDLQNKRQKKGYETLKNGCFITSVNKTCCPDQIRAQLRTASVLTITFTKGMTTCSRNSAEQFKLKYEMRRSARECTWQSTRNSLWHCFGVVTSSHVLRWFLQKRFLLLMKPEKDEMKHCSLASGTAITTPINTDAMFEALLQLGVAWCQEISQAEWTADDDNPVLRLL